MIGIATFLVLVLDISAIVDILKSSADTANKALWIVLILILPVIGMVLYFLIVKKKYEKAYVSSARSFIFDDLDRRMQRGQGSGERHRKRGETY